MFAARRCRLALMRGRWAEAESGLRELLDGQDDPGMIGRETVPVLARVLVRQGSADAPERLALAARHAATADVLEWLVPTGPHPAGWFARLLPGPSGRPLAGRTGAPAGDPEVMHREARD
jgi:hypothetical protein